MSSMQSQIDQLSRSNDELTSQVATLERNYQNVLHEMVVYQRSMAAQDSLMQNIISYFVQLESGERCRLVDEQRTFVDGRLY